MTPIFILQVKGTLAFFGASTRTITCKTAFRTRAEAEGRADAFKALCCTSTDLAGIDPETASVQILELELSDEGSTSAPQA